MIEPGEEDTEGILTKECEQVREFATAQILKEFQRIVIQHSAGQQASLIGISCLNCGADRLQQIGLNNLLGWSKFGGIGHG